MKRFVDLAELTRDEVLELLELARRLERRCEPRALGGKILGLVFFNPSLRTLASFQAAMALKAVSARSCARSRPSAKTRIPRASQ